MCCSANGSCLDSKYCYTDGLKGTVGLKGDLSDQRLTPAVNSTTVPYYSTDESSVSPCFQYANTGTTENGVYTVASDSTYSEPIVFESSGATLTLVNYKYAYGNRMSDSEDNPYSVNTAESGSGGGSNGGGSSYSDYYGGGDFEMSADIAMDEAMVDDWYGYYGGGYYGYYYYGGYGYYYYDPFVERTYKTSTDSRGYYTYQTVGDWSQYSAYYYMGETYRVSHNQTDGQKCDYANTYHYWSSYGKTTYWCDRQDKLFLMQHETFKFIGMVYGFVFAGVAVLVAVLASITKYVLCNRKEKPQARVGSI